MSLSVADGSDELADAVDELLHHVYRLRSLATTTAPVQGAHSDDLPTSGDLTCGDFWSTLRRSAAAVSKQCTTVAVAFQGQRRPSGGGGAQLVGRLTHHVKGMADLVAVGLTEEFRAVQVLAVRSLHDVLLELALSLTHFTLSIKPGGGGEVAQSRSQTQSTGSVWDACAAFDTKLCVDNVAAWSAACRSQLALVDDAIAELTQAGALLPRRLAAVLAPCLGLSKCCRACISHTGDTAAHGDHADPLALYQLVALNTRLSSISPALDDLACAFYELQEDTRCAHAGDELAQCAAAINTVVRGVISEFEASRWCREEKHGAKLRFIETALGHNVGKLKCAIGDLDKPVDENDATDGSQ